MADTPTPADTRHAAVVEAAREVNARGGHGSGATTSVLEALDYAYRVGATAEEITAEMHRQRTR